MELAYKNEKTLFAIAVSVAVVAWLLVIGGTLGIALIYVLLALLVYVFVQSAFISHLKGNGVRVTESQYPDLHRSLQRCCEKVGVSSLPEMYLLRTDFFNALATKFLGRNFIVLFTDVVDALNDEPGAVDFYVGHELGHIHRKHLRWGPFLIPALVLPVLGTAYRRAEEYTCDRYGAACCGDDEHVRAALAAISAGDTRWKTLNSAAYLEQIPATTGFWMSFHELTSDYPWLTKRMASALAFRRGEELAHPRRSFLAGLLSAFVPRFGVGGGASILVTIALVGILAAIAIPAYQDYTTRAHVAQAMNDTGPIRVAIEQYSATTGSMPGSLLDLDFEDEQIPTSDGRYHIGVYENGVIGIELGTDAAGNGQYLVLEPQTGDGGIRWVCYGQNAKQAQIPAACRNQ